MSAEIQINDRVRVHLGEKFGDKAGWYEGVVVRIDPYSEHRSFYWVQFDADAQSQLGMKQISVFNINNIQKI